MNKELIKKYKKEFDHWLNGGKLLYADSISSQWNDIDSIDAEIFPIHKRNPFAINESHTIVINDEYVEFRTALAEGKTIQYRTEYSNWVDYTDEKGNICNLFSSSNTVKNCYQYRIKPEEPQFKVGDWVRINEPTELLPHQKEVFKVEFIDKNDNLFGEDSSKEYGNSNYFSMWQP